MADTDKDADTSTGESGSSEVSAIQELLAECGIEEYDPRVVGMLMDAQFSLTTKLLEMASGLVKHNGKNMIDAEDVQASADILGLLQHTAPNREKMLQLALDKNAQPLPQIRHNYGLKLPNDRFCQLQQNMVFKANDFDTIEPHHIPNSIPMVEQQMTMLRPEQVQNILKRKATDDDFDS